jgi:hypothetical protein
MFALIKDAVVKRLKGERPGMLRALLVALLIGIAAAVVAYKLLRARVGTPIDSPKKETSSRPRQTRPKSSGKEGVGGLTDNKRLKKAPRRLRRRHRQQEGGARHGQGQEGASSFGPSASA